MFSDDIFIGLYCCQVFYSCAIILNIFGGGLIKTILLVEHTMYVDGHNYRALIRTEAMTAVSMSSRDKVAIFFSSLDVSHSFKTASSTSPMVVTLSPSSPKSIEERSRSGSV